MQNAAITTDITQIQQSFIGYYTQLKMQVKKITDHQNSYKNGINRRRMNKKPMRRGRAFPEHLPVQPPGRAKRSRACDTDFSDTIDKQRKIWYNRCVCRIRSRTRFGNTV